MRSRLLFALSVKLAWKALDMLASTFESPGRVMPTDQLNAEIIIACKRELAEALPSQLAEFFVGESANTEQCAQRTAVAGMGNTLARVVYARDLDQTVFLYVKEDGIESAGISCEGERYHRQRSCRLSFSNGHGQCRKSAVSRPLRNRCCRNGRRCPGRCVQISTELAVGNEAVVVALLETALKKTLGDGYLVSAESRVPGELSSQPDLVVWSRNDLQHAYLVELKTANRNFELPLTVANQARQMLEQARELNPQLILATTRRIGGLLREELDAQDVEIVQAEEPGKLADGITRIIRSHALARNSPVPLEGA